VRIPCGTTLEKLTEQQYELRADLCQPLAPCLMRLEGVACPVGSSRTTLSEFLLR
jgi:hypothetical protein